MRPTVIKLGGALLDEPQAHAAAFDARYLPMMMSRLQLIPSPTELIADVEKDITLAERWRIRYGRKSAQQSARNSKTRRGSARRDKEVF